LILFAFLMVMSMISVMLGVFSAELYSNLAATLGVFSAIAVVSLVVDWLIRARVGIQTASLEFEG